MRAYPLLILASTWAVLCLFVASLDECLAGEETGCPIVNCDDSDVAQEGTNGAFRGIYTLGFEMSEFVPSGSDCRWWLSGDTKPIWVATHSPQGMESAIVRVKVQGIVSQPGCYGHMGVCRRELNVTQILSAEVRGAERHEWVPLTLPVLPSPTPFGPLPPEKLRR